MVSMRKTGQEAMDGGGSFLEEIRQKRKRVTLYGKRRGG
jgi:hypothetical protein